MKEFKTVAFAGFEKSIREARLTRSAMIGELLGNAIAEVWFSLRRQADRLHIAIASNKASLEGRMTLPRHLDGPKHVVTPH